MKNVRFFAEYPSSYAKRKKVEPKWVVAVCTDDTHIHHVTHDRIYGAVCNALDDVDSPCYSGVSLKYLRLKCKRITVARAREIQPSIAEYMERD